MSAQVQGHAPLHPSIYLPRQVPPTHLPLCLAAHPGDDDDDDGNDDGPEKTPSCLDYTCHFVTVFWKVLFALVPPTDYWSGWACFTVSMGVIGLLTAVIGDLASHFGCTIGLKDSVTAVVFVALGTSVPGKRWLRPLRHARRHYCQHQNIKKKWSKHLLVPHNQVHSVETENLLPLLALIAC